MFQARKRQLQDMLDSKVCKGCGYQWYRTSTINYSLRHYIIYIIKSPIQHDCFIYLIISGKNTAAAKGTLGGNTQGMCCGYGADGTVKKTFIHIAEILF